MSAYHLVQLRGYIVSDWGIWTRSISPERAEPQRKVPHPLGLRAQDWCQDLAHHGGRRAPCNGMKNRV